MPDRPDYYEAIDRAVITNYALQLHAARLRAERRGETSDQTEPRDVRTDTDDERG